jgi:hypothetical protein
MFLVLPTFLSRLQGRENRWTHPWTSSSVEAGVAAGAACALSLGTIGDQGARSSASPATARRNQELCISSPHPNRNAPDFFLLWKILTCQQVFRITSEIRLGSGGFEGSVSLCRSSDGSRWRREGAKQQQGEEKKPRAPHSRSPPSFGTSSSRWSSR